MLFRLFRLREKGGLTPKWQRATHTGELGNLRVIEGPDPVLNRASRQADLLVPGTNASVPGVLTLRDVQLLRWSDGLVILAGIERLEDIVAGRAYDVAQTWWLEFESGETGVKAGR